MPRRARIVVGGYPHHVVQRGNNKQSVFFDEKDRELYLNLLKKYSLECECKILAYCLMNNHIHILIIPAHKDSLAKTMQKLSLTYTQWVNKKYKRTGRLWECRFHSAVIDRDSYLLSVCRYIEQNPVRTNIVDMPIKYRWSSARINYGEKKESFIEPIWKEYVDKAEYKTFLNAKAKESEIVEIRQSIFRGIPLGTKKFFNQLTSSFSDILNKRPRGRPRKIKK